MPTSKRRAERRNVNALLKSHNSGRRFRPSVPRCAKFAAASTPADRQQNFDFHVAIDLLRTNLESLTALVTHRFRLDQINQAFQTAADKNSGSIKVHLIPSGNVAT